MKIPQQGFFRGSLKGFLESYSSREAELLICGLSQLWSMLGLYAGVFE